MDNLNGRLKTYKLILNIIEVWQEFNQKYSQQVFGRIPLSLCNLWHSKIDTTRSVVTGVKSMNDLPEEQNQEEHLKKNHTIMITGYQITTLVLIGFWKEGG